MRANYYKNKDTGRICVDLVQINQSGELRTKTLSRSTADGLERAERVIRNIGLHSGWFDPKSDDLTPNEKMKLGSAKGQLVADVQTEELERLRAENELLKSQLNTTPAPEAPSGTVAIKKGKQTPAPETTALNSPDAEIITE
jgi:hypothetical protein